MRRIFRRFFWPVLRLPIRLILRSMVPKWEDPWERIDLDTLPTFRARLVVFPTAAYFRAYLQRPSAVAVNSLEEISTWLRGCRFDEQAYLRTDAWPPPRDFESLRSGQCFDHSLWGWRKLIELGVPALLVWGQLRQENENWHTKSQGHLWVQFPHEGVEYLFETTTKDSPCMVCHVADVRTHYRPWYAVDSDLRRYEYHGYYHTLFYDP